MKQLRDPLKRIQDLSQNLQSQQTTVQCEALLAFASLMVENPVPLFVNTGLMRIADLYQHTQNFVRYRILEAISNLTSEVNLSRINITNSEEIVHRFSLVLDSNDIHSRSITLRVLGRLAHLMKDDIITHRKVCRALRSESGMEIIAALDAIEIMLPIHPALYLSAINFLDDLVREPNQSPNVKRRAISCLLHCITTPTVQTRVFEILDDCIRNCEEGDQNLRGYLLISKIRLILCVSSSTEVAERTSFLYEESYLRDEAIATVTLSALKIVVLKLESAPTSLFEVSIRISIDLARSETFLSFLKTIRQALDSFQHSKALIYKAVQVISIATSRSLVGSDFILWLLRQPFSDIPLDEEVNFHIFLESARSALFLLSVGEDVEEDTKSLLEDISGIIISRITSTIRSLASTLGKTLTGGRPRLDENFALDKTLKLLKLCFTFAPKCGDSVRKRFVKAIRTVISENPTLFFDGKSKLCKVALLLYGRRMGPISRADSDFLLSELAHNILSASLDRCFVIFGVLALLDHDTSERFFTSLLEVTMERNELSLLYDLSRIYTIQGKHERLPISFGYLAQRFSVKETFSHWLQALQELCSAESTENAFPVDRCSCLIRCLNFLSKLKSTLDFTSLGNGEKLEFQRRYVLARNMFWSGLGFGLTGGRSDILLAMEEFDSLSRYSLDIDETSRIILNKQTTICRKILGGDVEMDGARLKELSRIPPFFFLLENMPVHSLVVSPFSDIESPVDVEMNSQVVLSVSGCFPKHYLLKHGISHVLLRAYKIERGRSVKLEESKTLLERVRKGRDAGFVFDTLFGFSLSESSLFRVDMRVFLIGRRGEEWYDGTRHLYFRVSK